MNKADKIKNFDVNGVGSTDGNLFGLPFDYNHAEIVIIPVPWEVTVSNDAGTAAGPQAILDYSPQIDLYDFDIKDAWKLGVHMLPISNEWHSWSEQLRPKAKKYILQLEERTDTDQQIPIEIDQQSKILKNAIKEQASQILNNGKIPAVLGGDHSTPLGLIEALTEKHADFGILQIDAHADLRDAYEGFTFSHASIMFNAIKFSQISKLVSVGVRDICEFEIELTEKSNGRIIPYYDAYLKETLLKNQKVGGSVVKRS